MKKASVENSFLYTVLLSSILVCLISFGAMESASADYYNKNMRRLTEASGASVQSMQRVDFDTPRQFLYSNLIFEVAPIVSSKFDSNALEYFRNDLDELSLAPKDRIMFITYKPDQTRPQRWTGETLLRYEERRRRLYDKDQFDDVRTVFVGGLRGTFSYYNGDVYHLAGIHYSRNGFAIFLDNAEHNQGTVLLHEFLHLIGLHKSGSGWDKNPAHCPNKNCVMYPTILSSYAKLDNACKEKLKHLIWMTLINRKLREAAHYESKMSVLRLRM